MIRPILSLKRLSIDKAKGKVCYQYGKDSSGLEQMDYLEFIARVIGVDINPDALDIAKAIGADVTINAKEVNRIPEAIMDITAGGADMSVDALGNPVTFGNSISCLKKRGRHIQIGIITGDDTSPTLSIDDILYKELRIIGSYGMQAYQYPVLLQQIISGKLQPQKLITNRVGLEEATDVLQSMDQYANIGITVIDQF